MKSADGIDIANQLVLKYGDYLEYLGGSSGIIGIPKSEEGSKRETEMWPEKWM